MLPSAPLPMERCGRHTLSDCRSRRPKHYSHIQQIVVDPLKRNNGYGAKILSLFLDICFNSYSFHRVQLFTDENNMPAISCYKKVGFHIDGLMRDVNKTENRYFGTFIFSILDDEWKDA